MPSQIVVFLVGAAATYAFLWALAYLNHDPREPSPVAGSIPFISPLFGLTTEKESFYLRMRQEISLKEDAF
ncbi:hypothetical protein VPNG_08368 [Cytospora leucostoma]|uniref:Uncharacterized protein n=1 Tax=Cytospora leucostoma TaxID=1230097 RepID=A0A423W9J3_9PEZI|nr:hypothetical protein VPNG_08368 [Cytospora leucostoma]